MNKIDPVAQEVEQLQGGEIPDKSIHEVGLIVKEEVEEDPDSEFVRKHWISTGALCFAMFSQTYFLINVAPYSGFMAMRLVPDLSTDTAGSYAGLIAAAYMVGRALSAFAWGKIADTVGRKPVFYLSFFFSAIFSIWFGTAKTLNGALFSRFMMGLLNGLILVVKTAVNEIAKGNEKLEARGTGYVLGVWGYGFLIGPVISALLSEPVKLYPNSIFVRYFKTFLSENPFFLPNFVSFVLCIISTAGIYFFVEETLPKERKGSFSSLLQDTYKAFQKYFPLSSWKSSKISKNEILPLRVDTSSEKNRSYSLQELPPKQDFQSTTSSAIIWGKDSTRHHLIAYWLFSFTSILTDEGFPLFAIASSGGLNLTETGVGKILSGSGILFILGQYFLFTLLVDRYGLYKTMLIGSTASVCIFLIPLALYLNRDQAEANDLSWSAFIFLCLILGIRNVGNIITVSSITIATNRTVTADQRASMNGISMFGGSIAKMLGPACAGFLVSFLLGDYFVAPVIGGILMFFIISICASYCLYFNSVVLGKYQVQAFVSEDLK